MTCHSTYSQSELASIEADAYGDDVIEAIPSTGTHGVWTKDEIVELLMRNDEAVGRALLAIRKRQTQDERDHHTTKYVNGIGFSAYDADIMTSMAEWFRDKGALTPKQLAFLRGCPGKQKVARICKYAGQLAEIAN